MTKSIKQTILLAILIVIWSGSWSINKMALDYTPPILFAAIRATLGGILLGICILPTWRKIQWRKHWVKYTISAFLNITIFFGVQTIGLVYLPGGLFSVLVYLQPVLVGLFAWLWLKEQMTFLKFLGLIVGFVGIFIISAEGISGNISLIGVILGLITAIGWALGVVYVKKVGNEVDGMWMIAIQSCIGGAILLVFGTIFESWNDIQLTLPFISGVMYTSLLALPVAYIIYYYLINIGEASKVTAYTFLVPVGAVIVSAIFLNEPITISLLLGLLFITLSIRLVSIKPRGTVSEEKVYEKESV